MSAASVPPAPAPSPALDSPAGGALNLIFTTLPALLRLTCGLAGAAVALSVRTPPVRVPLLLAVVVVLTAWSVWYAVRALRRGIDGPLVLGDVTLTTATCLLIPWLVAPEVLPGEGSWVAVLASTTVINAQASTAARLSIPAGLLVTAGYATGATWAGQPGEARAHVATLLVQITCTAMMATLMRRRIGRADRAFGDYQRVRREAVVARTAREVERRHNRDLHDTVLATLTMVGLGAVPQGSPALRERCADDLRTLSGSVEPTGGAGADRDDPSRGRDDRASGLDDRLRGLLDRLPELSVTARLSPCRVPPEVAEALTASTWAALSNVARHAPAARTTLSLTCTTVGAVVEVADDGPGFDPAEVPVHRYGLRESVRGRTESVGGRVEVHSRPGSGTRIRLEWPDVG
ncbi:sensor histidine kinase [Micromonospora sp. SH-82]|uniref:sensor histidine kinase n=1 Tax=Micromonospora sp. SH-82 TaxID=3132938 RepID=UPI003EBB2F72